jgi:hypothetical protein
MHETPIRYQTVAEGRAQADRLRPLNIVRRPASPCVICPDPSPEQMVRLNQARRRYGEGGLERIKGVIYSDGLMVIEFRIYKSGKPWRRQSIKRNGKVLFTAIRRDGYPSSWTVVRGANGRKPVGKRNLPERIADLLIRGKITAAEAAERGWNY